MYFKCQETVSNRCRRPVFPHSCVPNNIHHRLFPSMYDMLHCINVKKSRKKRRKEGRWEEKERKKGRGRGWEVIYTYTQRYCAVLLKNI